MRSIVLGLAALVATTSIAATMTSASARDRDDYRYRPPVVHRQYNNNVAPFFFGLFGMMLARPYYTQRYYYPSDPHVAWCVAHYKTYNPATNLFFIRRGVQAVCVSPYDRY